MYNLILYCQMFCEKSLNYFLNLFQTPIIRAFGGMWYVVERCSVVLTLQRLKKFGITSKFVTC